MGNSLNFCNNLPQQLQITHEPIDKSWLMRYGFDHQKTVEHRQFQYPLVCQKQLLQPIIQQLTNSKTQYADPDFSTKPIQLKSLSQIKRCRWARPQQVLDFNTVIYQYPQEKLIIKDQIMQYFGAFLVFIQGNSQLINQIIISHKNTYGLYLINIYLQNKEQILLIDDKFICDEFKKYFLFSQPLEAAIWPLILEKAWMKYLRSIKNIENHSPLEPYNLFVNRPYSTISLNNLQTNKIKDIISQNKNIIFESKKQNQVKIGLSGKKYFNLVCYFMINEQFFVLLRNPCGKFGFRGNWADPNLGHIKKVQELGYSIHTPGNFIIQQSQFEQFSNLIVFHYVKNYKTSSAQMNCQVNNPAFLKISIRADQEVFFSILQEGHELYPLMIDLFQIPSFQTIPTESIWATKVLNISQSKMYLRAGHYILRVKPKAHESISSPVTLKLNCYSIQPIQIQQNIQNQQLYYNYLQHLGKQSPSKQVIKLNFSYKLTWFSNRVIIYIRNLHKNNQQIKLDLHFPTLRNLQTLNESLQKINRKQYCTIALKDDFVLVLEKKSLHQETYVGEFSIVCC